MAAFSLQCSPRSTNSVRISSVRVRLVTDFDFGHFFAIKFIKKRDLETGAFFHYRLGPQDLVHVIFRESDIFGPLPRHAFSMKSSLISGFGSVSFSANCDLSSRLRTPILKNVIFGEIVRIVQEFRRNTKTSGRHFEKDDFSGSRSD